jgi:biopolymer transport protein ExbB
MIRFDRGWRRLTLLAMLVSAPVWAQDPQDQTSDAGATAPESAQEPAMESEVAAPREQAPSLEQAYQREFAFLQGQKADLERRLEALRERSADEKDALQQQIEALEVDVVEMRGRADRLDDLVFESERSVESARDNTDLLASTFMQADFTLGERFSPELGEAAPGADDVAALFAAAIEQARESASTHRVDGEFFLADGTRVDGDVIRVGQIAAYGLSERGSGVLAPAGDGGLKIWESEEAAGAVEALAAGGRPETLPMFIFESLATEVERGATKGFLDVVRSGGVIGWIIFALGLVGGVLVILRIIFLQGASASTSKIIDMVGAHVRRGDREAAQEMLKRRKGATSRVVAAAIRNLDRDREHLEDIVSEAILHESSHLNRFGAIIMVIAAVSPLLGLLGTVTGMISTFDVITEFGTGDPKLLSGGISIALVTTQLGLIVAIPLLLLGNVLSGWAERIKDDMEKATLRVINQYFEARSESAGEAAQGA